MKYTHPSSQSLSFSLIILIILKFYDCYEICINPKLANYKKEIFEGDNYKYSHYYYYSQTIRRNQSLPVVIDRFEKLESDKKFNIPFKFQFYGTDVSTLTISHFGFIEIHGEEESGLINIFLKRSVYLGCEILNDKKLLAVRQLHNQQIGDKLFPIKVTILIHEHGKISFYYDEIPKGLTEEDIQSEILGKLFCGVQRFTHIKVPVKWVESRTLVEYEFVGDCPKHNTNQACRNASTSNTTCIWCGKPNMCITNNDKDTHDFEENGCLAETKDVNISSEPTLIVNTKTTQGINEFDSRNELKITTQNTESHLNTITGMTKIGEQRKSHKSLCIVIPIIVMFVVICIGVVVGLWLYRRKKSHH
uniref:Egg protein CP391S-like protein n=1 Tax=Schistosoma mansoni TaxID=6183 RepID=A0AA82N7W3_SCHMA